MQTKIAAALQLTNAFQTLHTVDSHRWLTINRILLTNVTAGPITVQVCFVSPTGSPAADNAVLWNYTVAANSIFEFGKGLILYPKWTIQALASAGTSMNAYLSGIEDV